MLNKETIHNPEIQTRTAVDMLLLTPGRQFVLLGLRKSEAGQGTWGLIGGRQEPGEQFIETITREKNEELGDDCQVEFTGRLVAVRQNCIPPKFVPHVTIITEAIFHGGSIKYNEWELADCMWFPLDQLPVNLFSGTKEIIDNFSNGKIGIVTDWHLPSS